MTRDELLKKTANIEAMTKKLVGRDGANMSEKDRVNALGRRGQLSRDAQRASDRVRLLRNEAAHAVHFAPNPTQVRKFRRDLEHLESELQRQVRLSAAHSATRVPKNGSSAYPVSGGFAGSVACTPPDQKPEVKRAGPPARPRQRPPNKALWVKGAVLLGMTLIASAFK